MAIDIRMPILVVHNHDDLRRLTIKVLNEIGFQNIDEAQTSLDALNLIEQARYGLIISDIDIKIMDKLLVEYVRAHQDISMTPFIVMIDEPNADDGKLAMDAGANTFVIKGFNAATLKSKIEQVFRN